MDESEQVQTNYNIELNSAANTLIIGFLTILSLYYLKVILLPLSVAVILYMLILPSEKYLFDKIGNSVAVYVTLAFFTFFIAYSISNLLYSELSQFIDNDIPELQSRLEQKLDDLSNLTINGVEIGSATSLVTEFASSDRINSLVTWIAGNLASLFSNSVTVFILLVFLILEGGTFPDRLRAASPSLYVKMEKIVSNSSDAVNNYILVRFFISVGQASVCTIIMLIFGIPGVMVWAILYAILEWIPVIGAASATIPPTIVALLWLDPVTALIMTTLLIVNCSIFASFIEPQIAGDKLGLSPIVLILSLMGWGVLWGPVGLITGPVLTVVVRIMLEESDSLRPYGIMLGKKDVYSEE